MRPQFPAAAAAASGLKIKAANNRPRLIVQHNKEAAVDEQRPLVSRGSGPPAQHPLQAKVAKPVMNPAISQLGSALNKSADLEHGERRRSAGPSSDVG